MDELFLWLSYDESRAEYWRELIRQELESGNGKAAFVMIEGIIIVKEESFLYTRIVGPRIREAAVNGGLLIPLMVKFGNEMLNREFNKLLVENPSYHLTNLRGFVWRWSGRRLWPEINVLREGESWLAELLAIKV